MLASVLFGGGMPIGFVTFLPESGDKAILGGNSEWLRIGSVISKTGYAVAATIETLKVSGAAQVTLPASVAVTQIATDGAGTFVATYGDATNVLVSTDGGSSWSTVAHNLPSSASASGVSYGGGRFVVVGNTTSAMATSWSTTAASFTAGATQTVSSGVAGTARIGHNGSSLFICACGASGAGVRSTTDGTTLSGNLSVTQPDAPKVSHNGTNWLIASSNTAEYLTSPDGVTFTAQTGPVAAPSVATVAGLFVVPSASSNTYYTSSTGATGSWTARTLPTFSGTWPGGIRFGSAPMITNCGSRLYVGVDTPAGGAPVVMWSDDAILWSRRWTLVAAPGASSGWAVCCDSSRAVFLPLTSSAVATYTADFSIADFIGGGTTMALSPLSGATYPVGYVRIK